MIPVIIRSYNKVQAVILRPYNCEGCAIPPKIHSGPKFTRDLPETRRQQLIEATARCLARDGLAGTSVRHVAAEAGVSPGLVRHHFAGMQDLIAETYRATGKQIA